MVAWAAGNKVNSPIEIELSETCVAGDHKVPADDKSSYDKFFGVIGAGDWADVGSSSSGSADMNCSPRPLKRLLDRTGAGDRSEARELSRLRLRALLSGRGGKSTEPLRMSWKMRRVLRGSMGDEGQGCRSQPMAADMRIKAT